MNPTPCQSENEGEHFPNIVCCRAPAVELVRLETCGQPIWEQLYNIRFSEAVHNNFGGSIPTLEDHLAWVASLTGTRVRIAWAIFLGKQCIGGCTLKNISELNSNCEFDIYISPEMSGRKIGMSAMLQLLTHAFQTLALHRVYAYYLKSNKAAERLYEKLNMKKEGALRENVFKSGRYHNSVMVSMLSEEWLNLVASL